MVTFGSRNVTDVPVGILPGLRERLGLRRTGKEWTGGQTVRHEERGLSPGTESRDRRYDKRVCRGGERQ